MTEDKEKHHGGGFGFALVLIIAGTILLLNNFGVLPWHIWEIILKFWPALLIIAGIDNLLGGSLLGNLLSFIISLFIISFVFAIAISAVNKNFDRYLTKKIPQWDRIQQNFPQYNQKNILKCNPFTDDSCYRIYNQ